MDINYAIRNTAIFSDLKEKELELIKNIVKEVKFNEGETIMQEGEIGDTMYIMVKGEVEVSKNLTMKFGEEEYKSTEKILSRLSSNDHAVFGEMALIGKETRSASIIARSECILLEIKRDNFINLVISNPDTGVKILLRLCELLTTRLRKSDQDVIRLTTALSIALSK